MKTTLLVDGNNLLMRAVFGSARSMMQAGGVSTGPLQVFVNSLSAHIREEKPDHVAVAWDGGKSEMRTALSADYKGQRNPSPHKDLEESSFELAKTFLALSGLTMFSLKGFEADDLIAAWWRGTKPWDADRIVILSSDKDFLQLAGRNPGGVRTEQVRLSSYGTPTDRWDAARVRETYGCVPSQLPAMMALTGDNSDNIKGVPGVGPKRALKLLDEHGWSLQKVAEGKSLDYEQIQTNYKLVNLREGVTKLPPLPDFKPTSQGDMLYPRLISFLVKYELNTIRDRLDRGVLWHAGTAPIRTGRPFRRPQRPAAE